MHNEVRQALQDPAHDRETEGSQISEAKVRLGIGILGLAGFVYYTWDAYRMPMGQAAMPGPGLFPLIVGLVGLVMAGFVIVDAVMKLRDEATISVPTRARAIQVGGIVVLLGGYVLAFGPLGAYLSSFLFTVLSVKLLGDRSWVKCILIGACIALPIIFFFSEMLNVSLPSIALF